MLHGIKRWSQPRGMFTWGPCPGCRKEQYRSARDHGVVGSFIDFELAGPALRGHRAHETKAVSATGTERLPKQSVVSASTQVAWRTSGVHKSSSTRRAGCLVPSKIRHLETRGRPIVGIAISSV